MRNWTPEGRKKQAEAIRRSQPWKKSTGPKTVAGKNRSKINAYKEGTYTEDWQILRHALLLQREFVRDVQIWNAAEKRRQKILRERTDKK